MLVPFLSSFQTLIDLGSVVLHCATCAEAGSVERLDERGGIEVPDDLKGRRSGFGRVAGYAVQGRDRLLDGLTTRAAAVMNTRDLQAFDLALGERHSRPSSSGFDCWCCHRSRRRQEHREPSGPQCRRRP
jgi:hypothetical protein